jgi:hypothetical protein
MTDAGLAVVGVTHVSAGVRSKDSRSAAAPIRPADRPAQAALTGAAVLRRDGPGSSDDLRQWSGTAAEGVVG